MSIQVEIDDPDREIEDIYLVHSSDQCIVLLIELSAAGKNQNLTSEDDQFCIRSAIIRVTGLPFVNYHFSSSTVRYTCFLTLISSEAVESAETLYHYESVYQE